LFPCWVKVCICKDFTLEALILYQFSSLCMVNDMDQEEEPWKNLFYKDVSSRKTLKLPVENNSTEISRGTLSSHPVSQRKNSVIHFSLRSIFLSWEMMTAWLERRTRYTFGGMGHSYVLILAQGSFSSLSPFGFEGCIWSFVPNCPCKHPGLRQDELLYWRFRCLHVFI
jgi:hypothetical protein